MQPDSLARFYASKSDGELLALAADLDALTDEARPVLADELRRRSLTSSPPPSDVAEYQISTSRSAPIGKVLRTIGIFAAHLVAAVLGTGMVESSIWALFGRPQSLTGIEVKTWISSLTIATVLGFVICKFQPSKSAMWIWVIPGVIFTLRVWLYGFGSAGSVAKHFLHQIA